MGVDNCSKDRTLEILSVYEDKYDDISVNKGKQNIEYIKNFERGVKLAQGEYIAFSDQDDY